MIYPQSNEWVNYCKLMQERPDEFKNTGKIDIVTDIQEVENFVEKTGKK